MKKGASFYIIIGVAVLLGLAVTSFFGGLTRTEKVVVAAHALPVGARLYPDDLEVREIHASAVLPGAFHDPAEALGQLLNVPRLPGEQITADVVGSRAVNAIATTLDPDWRAVGVHVSRAQGVAGVLRPGDSVEVVGIIDTGVLGTYLGFSGEEEEAPPDPGVLARVVIHDARVVLVPQSFRYQELPETGEEELSLVQAAAASTDEGDVVLAVPVTPITFTLGTTETQEAEAKATGVVGLYDTEPVTPTVVAVSPVELLALLNSRGEIHLALEPVEREVVETPGLALRDLVLWLTPRREKGGER